MCGCLFLVVGAVFPRLGLILLEIFSDWNDTAFDSFWIGFIGWLFLPYTTLAYVLMDQWGDPINGFGWVIVDVRLHRRPRQLVRDRPSRPYGQPGYA